MIQDQEDGRCLRPGPLAEGGAVPSPAKPSVPNAFASYVEIASAPLHLNLSTGATVAVHFVPSELFPRIVAALRAVPDDWKPLEQAPYKEVVEVCAGRMTFLAMLIPNASLDDDEVACDQWVAHIEGQHPPCWSGGACWANNEDEATSLQPDAWRYHAQGIEVATASETQSGSTEGESPVPKGCANTPAPTKGDEA